MIEHLERIIVLRLPIKLRQLGKIIINHNGLVDLPLFGIRNANASIFLVCRIEFAVDPEAGSFRVAYRSVVIDDEGAVTSGSRFVNQSKVSFLDDSTALFSIALELDDEETHLISKMREFEFTIMNLVLGIRILCGFLKAGNHTVKINGGVERLQVLLVVGLGVELENFDRERWDVFDLELEDHFFLNFERVLVGFFEFQDDLILDHFVSGRINILGEIDEAVVRGEDLILVLKLFEIRSRQKLLVALKLTRILLADPLQVLRNDIRS